MIAPCYIIYCFGLYWALFSTFILILQKTVNRSRKNWSKKLDDALWAYRTAYKNPMGMSPYKMVYGKACHLPLELEHKAYWAIKEVNYDFKLAGEKRLFDISSLDEWRTQAYENAKLFKEKVKRWHDKRIQKREFNVGDYVLLYNSRLRFFADKLLSKWEGPYVIEEVYRSGAIKINNFEGTNPKVVNGQSLTERPMTLKESLQPIRQFYAKMA